MGVWYISGTRYVIFIKLRVFAICMKKHILKSENVCERPGFPLKWGVPLLDIPSSKSTVECFLIKNIRHKGRSDIILCYQFYFDYFYLLFLCGADFMGITFWTYFSVHPWIQVTFLSKGF